MQDQRAAVSTAPVDGPPEPTTGDPARRLRPQWIPLVVLVAAVAAWFRVPATLHDNLYAEDGVLFVGDWGGRGNIALFWEPYAGYQHLLPRFGSWLAVATTPVEFWGYAVSVFSCLAVGVVAGAVYAFSADLVPFWPARVVVSLLVVLAPMAGVEALGNLANLHWFMLYLVPWVLLFDPRTRWGRAGAIVAILLATLIEPTCLIFAPLALWRLVVVRRERLIVLAWAVGVAVQLATTLLSPRESPPGRPPWLSLILGYVMNVGMSTTTSRPVFLAHVVLDVGWWIGIAWTLGLLLFVAVGVWFAGRAVQMLLASLILGSLVSWSASFYLNNQEIFYYSVMTPEQLLSLPLVRWGTAASMMLLAAVAVTVGVLVGRFPRVRWAGLAVLALMLAAMLVDLRPRPLPDFPSWSAQVREDEATCRTSTDPVMHLNTAPSNWELGVYCWFADR